MNPPGVIRKAIPTDACDIASVRVTSWQKAYRGIIPDGYLDSLHPSQDEAHWRESIAAGRPLIIVTEADGEVMGFSAFGPSRDDGAPPGTGEIWAIYVSPPHWSKGVGRQLCQESLRQLTDLGMSTVGLWVLTGNARARRFYVAAGFEQKANSKKTFELSGAKLEEILYSRHSGKPRSDVPRSHG